MIPELLLSLVGFTGGVIVERDGTFAANMDFDMITEAEREQINKIVPLGWLYRELSKYASQHGTRWGSQNGQIYKSAFCLAISDVLEGYKADVADLESKFNREGPFPLSHLLHQLQKYLLALPAANNCCKIVESKKIRGCQFLDFLSNYRTGVPTVSDMITRLLRRVRVVFLKQCLAWALRGELEDLGREFFIQMRAEKSNTDGPGDGPQSSMSAVLASGRGVGGRQPFDWTATYTLRLEMLPESHVSPRMAAKILFCGKAVRMLMETAAELRRLDVRDGGRERDQTAMGSAVSSPVGAIYGYVSSGGGSVLSTAEDGGQDEPAQPFPEEPSLTDEGQVFIDSVMARHAEQSGYTLDELDLFSNHFHSIVGAAPTSFVGSFESLIESVNKTISSRLWLLLKNRFGFIQFLVGLRNTYLLGKGEMFQAFLDGILKLMSSPAPADSQVDAVLTWDVVRSAAKLLNLDEDVLADVLKLRVNSPSVSVVDFSVGDMVKLHGVYTLGDLSEGSRHRHVCLGMPSTHANGSASPGLPPVVSAALTVISRGEAVISSVGAAVSSALSYSSAAATLNDAKYILKGFTSMCLFTCEWNEVVKQLSPAHPLMPRVPSTENSATVHPAIMLGSILCTLHDTPLVQPPPNVAAIGAAAATVPSPYGLAAVGGALRCVGVGVSVHARVVSVGADKLDYFARVFIWSNHPASGETFTAGASEISLGPSVSSPGKSAYATGRRFSSGNIEGHILSTSGEIPLAFGASSLSSPEDHTAGVLQAAASLALEVEYYRDLTRMTDSEMVSTSSSKTAAVRVPTGKGVVNGIRARLRARNSSYSIAPSSSWDTETVLDLDKHMRLLGGQCGVSVVGSGLFLPAAMMETAAHSIGGASLFNFNVSAFTFLGKGSSLSTYPVASSATSTRFPPTFTWLDARMSHYRAWLSLKLQFRFPHVFGIVVDQDAVSAYSRIFSSLIKVRLVVHAFERLILSRSALDTDRQFCHLRHAMHFFNSNLMYHLQVDVIDTEFSILMSEVRGAVDFQSVLRAHKNFVASIVRMSHIDNNVVQDAIERVLQICLRFLAVSALHQHNEDVLQASAASPGPVGEVFYLPQEEFGAIRKDFFMQVSYLLQLMKKIENRGFVFRVDFNGFFSQISNSGDHVNIVQF